MKFHFKTPISVNTARMVLAAALAFTASSAIAQSNLDSVASREIVRRQENLVAADKLVAKGDQAMGSKDYETAYVSYLDALDSIPAGSATDRQRAIVLGKFSNAGMEYAESLIASGRYGDAERVAKTILLPQYNPGYTPAVRLLSNLEQPDYYSKTTTPQFAANREEVSKLLSEGEGFFQAGRYDLAITRYEQVLNIDPYNSAARKGMEQVNLAKTRYYNTSYNETRARMLWLVERAWERPVRRFVTDRNTSGNAAVRGGIRNTEAITAKLNRIIIPKVDLRDTSVREAVEFLKQRSRDLDTTAASPQDKRGVNIVLKLATPVALPPAPVDPTASPATEAPAAVEVTSGGNADTRVTLNLSNVPLIEALRYLTDLAGLKYKVEPYAVSIVPITENTTDLVTKEYRVPPGFIPNAQPSEEAMPTGNTAITATPSGSRLSGRVNALDYLKSHGIEFPPGSFAQYVPTGSKLIVRATPDAIDTIDFLVDAAFGVQPTQVEIESKFLEITQNNMSELGFDWLLGPLAIGSNGVYGAGGTAGFNNSVNAANYPFTAGGSAIGANPVTSGLRSGFGNGANSAVSVNGLDALLGAGSPVGAAPAIFGVAGIFTNPQFQLVIRALNQKKGVDLMSAPKVTTKSGKKAIVRVVREFPYPTEFNPPEPPPAQTGSSSTSIELPFGSITSQGVVTPSTPTAFERRNLGVTLEVDPVIGPDGYTIDLNLSPEVVEFEGFINYGTPINGPIFNGVGIDTVVLTSNTINQPIFSTRKVTTSVSIWDGQTVSLGGLIREDVQKVEDKVPFLGDIPLAGRLFRSNVDQKIKRNLIIFVTARLMDAEGRPIRQDEDQEEIVEPLGLPQELPPPTFDLGKGGSFK